MYTYVHGGDGYDQQGNWKEGILDFSANINPLGMPAAVVNQAQGALTRAVRYPDSHCRALRARLAAFEGVNAEEIFCGNGASDILFRLTAAVKPERILVTAPSFADYARAGAAAGAQICYHFLSREEGFAVTDRMLETIRQLAPGLVFLCNPNNPTGGITAMEQLEALAAACKQVQARLVVDECFLDFVPEGSLYSGKHLLNRYENIFLLKAFTKLFAMPGLRLGYGITKDRNLLQALRFHGPDWPVSNVAMAAGIAALEHAETFIRQTVTYLSRERQQLSEALAQLGFTVYPSQANFILFRDSSQGPDEIGPDLAGELRSDGILIRDCRNFTGLTIGDYRTAVLTSPQNQQLAAALRKIVCRRRGE